MTLDEFMEAWHTLVARELVGRSLKHRRAVIDRLLARGLAVVAAEKKRNPRARHAGVDEVEAAERELVAASGLLDVPGYTRANGRVRSGWVEPLEHFCGVGWRDLCNPNRDFDLWWYWCEYLDPARETVNPLVHYLLEGRRSGMSAVPDVRPARDVPVVEVRRRAALFAGFDPHGVVDDYVVAYVAELARHADVFYVCDGYLPAAELDRLAPYTKGRWAVPHGRYDFGSYSLLAGDLVGWDTLERYDEVVLVNDSGYLLRDLDEVFETMSGRTCDWWGLQASKHDYHPYQDDGPLLPLADAKRRMIGERHLDEVDHLHVSSYFLALRRRVIEDPGFRKRLDAVVAQQHKSQVIRKYEIGISRYLMVSGFDVDTFIPDLYPFHPIYTQQYFELLGRGFPLLKRNLLVENNGKVPDLGQWKQRVLAELPEADVDVIDANVSRVGPDDKLRYSFSLTANEPHTWRVRRPLNQWEIAEEDAYSPTFDHWWAFVVDGADHTLTGSLRAVFEEVRLDPSLKKVVLTRSRRVVVDGANVECVPRDSPEGQRLAARCRYIFVREAPSDGSLGHFSPQRHEVVQLGGVPLRPYPPDAGPEDGPSPYRFVVTGSRSSALAAPYAYPRLTADATLVTGAPRNDLVLRASDRLPSDLRAQEQTLLDTLGGRPLVQFAPAFDAGEGARRYPVLEEGVVEALAAWAERREAVIGYVDDVRDRARSLSSAFEHVGVGLDLRRAGVVDDVVVDRVAAALVSDLSTRSLDFGVTGRPTLLWVDASSEAAMVRSADSLPVRTVRTTRELDVALDDALAGPGPIDRAVSEVRLSLVHALVDDRSSRRLVRWLRTRYVEPGAEALLSAEGPR